MINPVLANFFKTNHPLNKDGLEETFRAFRHLSVKKGELLLRSGEYARQLVFLTQGVVREYYSTPEKEININFYDSPQFITDFSAFIDGKITRKNQEALSEVKLSVIDKLVFQQLLAVSYTHLTLPTTSRV